MRDTARIDNLMRILTENWKKYPDMRFFQFVSWVEQQAKEQFDIDDLFFLEDDLAEQMLWELLYV